LCVVSIFFFNVIFSIAGAIHAGLGYNQIRNFLSELNLPIMSKSCYQRHEKKVGKILREYIVFGMIKVSIVESFFMNQTLSCVNLLKKTTFPQFSTG
jgi:hypothetical protein